jgi:hypothetical protein
MIAQAISPGRKLARLADVASLVLADLYTPDCCIAATRAGLAVLEHLRIKAQPRACIALAMNREWLAGERALPAWAVMIDPDETIARPAGFAGHLVIVGKVGSSKFLLDMSAGQFDRPGREINVPGAVLAGLRKPLPLASPWGVSVNLKGGGLLGYSAHPYELEANTSYKTAPDWTLENETAQRTHAAAVAQLIEAIERTTP